MVWLVDAYDEAGRSAIADFLPRLPAGTRVARAADGVPVEIAGCRALVVTGSAASLVPGERAVWADGLRALIREALDAGVPVLGVCFGQQALADALGAPIRRMARAEVGWTRILRAGPDPVLDALPGEFESFSAHEDEVVPVGLEVLAGSAGCAVQAVRAPGRSAWGVQFHLEMGVEEAGRVLAQRAALHPGEAEDLAGEAARVQDTGPLADALFASFLRVAGVPWGPVVEGVSGSDRQALRDELARVKHDLGKYVHFQQRWLAPGASEAERREAVLADLLHTRRGPEGSLDAASVWADFRPRLVGVGLDGDPDLARLDGSMRALEPLIAALRGGAADDWDVRRASRLSASVAEAVRSLAARAR